VRGARCRAALPRGTHDHRARGLRARIAQPARVPENPYPCELLLAVKVGKTPYVRFDLNDYTIPYTHVRRTLTVCADPRRVRILDGADLLATHERSYDRGAQIEIATHIDALVARKREARHHRGLDHLVRAAPASRTLMLHAAARGGNLGNITTHLLRLLWPRRTAGRD